MIDTQRWLITRDIHTLVFVTAVVRTKTKVARTAQAAPSSEKSV